MSQIFLTLLLYFTLLLKHTSHLSAHMCTESLKASNCCPVCEHPFLGKGKEQGGKDGNISGYIDQKRSCQRGRADLFFPEQQLSQGFGRVQMEDFFPTSFPGERGEMAHKGCVAEGFVWAPVAGGFFLTGWSSHSCFPAHCKDAFVNSELRSLLRNATSRRPRFDTCV